MKKTMGMVIIGDEKIVRRAEGREVMLRDFADVFGAIEACMDEARKKMRDVEPLHARIAELEAAIEPFRRVKGITSVYEYVPVEALRDDEVFNFRMNGAEMKTIYAALKGEK